MARLDADDAVSVSAVHNLHIHHKTYLKRDIPAMFVCFHKGYNWFAGNAPFGTLERTTWSPANGCGAVLMTEIGPIVWNRVNPYRGKHIQARSILSTKGAAVHTGLSRAACPAKKCWVDVNHPAAWIRTRTATSDSLANMGG